MILGAVSQAVEGAHLEGAALLVAIAVLLIAAKVFHVIEKIKQPPVVGELLAGILLGSLGVAGLSFFTAIQGSEIIHFFAEIGVILLLFQIGLESNVRELTSVGMQSFLVAIIGATVPFLLGAYLIGPLFFSAYGFATHLFIGASLAATSVGITSRVFKDLGKMQTPAAKIVLGAAVIDDILALILLAIVSSIASTGTVSIQEIALIIGKSFGFLIGSVLLGQIIAPWLSKAFSMINTGMGSKFTLAVSFGLLFAGIAESIGLEPIIGAFSAGIVLDPVHFKRFKNPEIVDVLEARLSKLEDGSLKTRILKILHHHSERSIEEIIEPLVLFFVPIFFVTTGMGVNLATLLHPQTIGVALVISVVAIFGKVIAGFATRSADSLLIGVAMVPRGEVGLIFAAVGQSLGVLTPSAFSIIVLTMLITTIVGPAGLTWLLKRR